MRLGLNKSETQQLLFGGLYCVYFMCLKGIRAWLQHRQLALRGPICAKPLNILERLLWRLSAVAAARQSMHTEDRPSQAADITIIISYSSEHCWSPSAPRALHT